MKKTMLRLGLIGITVVIFCIEVFGWAPIPTPTFPAADSNKPAVIGSISKVTNTFPITLSFDIDVVTTDGIAPTMSSTTLTFNTPVVTNVSADPNGLAKMFTYRASRQITNQGLYYSTYTAKNQYNQMETQYLEYKVVRSSAPVTTGCRVVNQ